MTSIAKTSLTYDSSQLVQGDTADATDVLLATNDLLENDQAGRLSVTASDTHIKHLNDALAAGSGIAKAVTNSSGDEALSLSVDTAVVATLTGSQSLSNKTLVTPTIASMANANHNHQNSAGGGQLALAALSQSGASSGEVPTWNGSGWTPAPPGGTPAPSPVDVTTIVAGETLAERDFVYLSATGWKKVDIDASPVAMGRTRGLVIEAGGIANGVTGAVRIIGEVTGFAGLTANALVFAATTAGGYTQTRPTPSLGGSQVAVVPIGLAVSTSRILLMGPLKMQYRKRANVPHTGALLIEHHDDPFGEGRRPFAFTNTSVPTTIQTYATSNVDTNVALKGPEVITIDAVGGANGLLGDVTGNERRWAQGITLARAGYITQVAVTFGSNTGSPTGNVTCAIYTDAAGVLGTLLQSTTLAPTASTVNTFTFSSPVLLPASTQLYILLQADPQASGASWGLTYNTSGSYTGGTLRADAATGTTFPNTFALVGGAADMKASFTMIGADSLAQSFSHSTSADISIIKLWLRKQGSPTGNLTVALYSDSAGVPGSLLATSSVVVASDLTGTYALYEFVFSAPVSITGSTTYHWRLASTDSYSSTNYVEVGADTSSSSYANGIGQRDHASTWSALGGDFVFDIMSIPTGYGEPCVVGRASGGTRDIAVRYDSGTTGVNTATNTQGRNVTGGTLDMTFVVEMD